MRERTHGLAGKRWGQQLSQSFDFDQQHLRWSQFVHEGDPDKLLALVRDEVFKHFREHTSDIRFGDYMKDARLVIEKPSLLVKAIQMINELPLESGDTKGDLYEYLLSKLTTAGSDVDRHLRRIQELARQRDALT